MAFEIRVNRNEATAARRRVYFFCLDAIAGVTPVTTEAGGQPQVSVDGGAWTDTGIGVLVDIGNGHYYADLTQAVTDVADAVIKTRYKSANTIEFPGSTLVIDAKVEGMFATGAALDAYVDNRLTRIDNGDGTVTVVLYDDNSTTPLKTWVYTKATANRAKAT
jgi:hypothetical protein